MFKHEIAIFSGISGKPYNFIVFNMNTQFKSIAAVYIFAEHAEDLFLPIYIGQTTDLKDRIQNHEKWPCAIRHHCNCLCIRKTEQQDLFDIETDLIRNYATPCNF